MEVETPSQTAQQRFSEQYITASEIAREVRVSRPSVMRARERNLLPDAVCVGDGNIYIWERSAVRPHIDAWKLNLAARRRETQ